LAKINLFSIVNAIENRDPLLVEHPTQNLGHALPSKNRYRWLLNALNSQEGENRECPFPGSRFNGKDRDSDQKHASSALRVKNL